MKLLPFVRIFFAPDMGDTSAAVAEPPADTSIEATPSAADVLAELSSFDAPNPNVDADPNAEAKPDDPKPEEKVTDPKPPEPKPGDKKVSAEPPAKQLREELERTRKERDEFKSKLENHPRVKELESSIAELTKERDAIKADVEKTRKELDIRDPLASSRLREHQETFDKEFQRSIEFVPEIEGQYQDLVTQFARLPRNDREQYRAALGEFEARVEELVGQRKFGPAMDIIRKGYDFIGQHNQLRKEVTENASKLAYEARESEWKKHETEVSGALGSAFEIPEGIEDTDPYNPALFVTRALDQIDEGKRKELVGTIDNFCKRVFAGQKPRSDKDFPGMDPKEIQEKIAAEGKWHAEARPTAVKMMKQGMLALSMLRPICAELAKLRERVKKEGDAIPPNPNNGADPKGGSDDDIGSYQAPAIRI